MVSSGQPLPDRQQQAGDDVEIAVGEFGHRRDLGLPGARRIPPAPPPAIGSRAIRDRRSRCAPSGAGAGRAVRPRHRRASGSAPAPARRRGPIGALTSKRARGIAGAFQRLGEGEWPVAIPAPDREHLRLGAGLGMNIERAAIRDGQALGRDGLDPEVIGAGRDGALDPGRAADPRTRRTACSEDRWSAPAAG